MTTPLPFLQEQLELMNRLESSIEMMENHLAGRLPQVGMFHNEEDVTPERVAELKEQFAAARDRVERMTRGNDA
jgi:hypothetical protein